MRSSRPNCSTKERNDFALCKKDWINVRKGEARKKKKGGNSLSEGGVLRPECVDVPKGKLVLYLRGKEGNKLEKERKISGKNPIKKGENAPRGIRGTCKPMGSLDL